MRRLNFLTLVGGLGLLTLLSLGVWQLQRQTWKTDLLQTIDSRIAAAPVAVPLAPSKDQDRYRSVAATGHVETEELHVFWVTKSAKTGYRVISAFVTTEGRRLLLDRGFIPAADKNALRQSETLKVTGNLLWPDEGDWTTPPPEVDTNILYARDLAYMADRLGTEPVLIVASSTTPETTVAPHAVTSSGIPNNHLQYAITWFSLALIWVAMTLYFLRRSRAKSES